MELLELPMNVAFLAGLIWTLCCVGVVVMCCITAHTNPEAFKRHLQVLRLLTRQKRPKEGPKE